MPRITGTLDNAEEAFLDTPTPAKAGDYLAALMEYEADGMIDDDTWLDGLAAVRDWLQAWPLGWMKADAS